MPERTTIFAWTAAVVLIAAAAGGYLLWIHHTRAGYHARSLSASGHPAGAQPAKTRNLHVDGCDKDFLVKVSELVEPRAIPGAPLAAFEKVYGPPAKPTRSSPIPHGVTAWESYPFTLTESKAAGAPQELHLAVNPGHVVQTLDDIELGIDSFAAIFRKARDRNIEIHERIRRNDGPIPGFPGPSWTLIVSFDSSCSRRFRSEYSRTLASTAEIDGQIKPSVTKTDGQVKMESGLYRSSVFMNKVAFDYTMALSNGQSDATDGSPSEHQ
ncbi:MAG TPA: hypothetical protein VL346_07645 [Acidobacteriaceae bacterium]|nr:hypothetical protein [Acidobacteriaceae bacterium]